MRFFRLNSVGLSKLELAMLVAVAHHFFQSGRFGGIFHLIFVFFLVFWHILSEHFLWCLNIFVALNGRSRNLLSEGLEYAYCLIHALYRVSKLIVTYHSRKNLN